MKTALTISILLHILLYVQLSFGSEIFPADQASIAVESIVTDIIGH